MSEEKQDDRKQRSSHRSKTNVQSDNPANTIGSITAPPEIVAGGIASDSDQKANQKKYAHPAKRAWAWFIRGNRPFTIAVALSTVVNVGVTYYQWRTMDYQNALMLDLAWLERRPWLNIEMPTLKELVADKPLEIDTKIKNTGPTPAYVNSLVHNINQYASLGVSRVEIEPRPREPTKIVVNTIPPEELLHGSLDKSHILSQRELEHIKAGLLFLTINIRVEYSDGQGRSHVSWLTATYDVDLNRFTGRGKYRHMD